MAKHPFHPDSRGYAPPVPSRDLRCPSIHPKNVMYRAVSAPPSPIARCTSKANREKNLRPAS